MSATIFDSENVLEDVFLLTKAELKKGAKMRRHPFKYFALSSASDNDLGSRMVVLRDFNDEWDCMVYTDIRSNKVKQLQTNPMASLLFYHHGKKFQVVIKAKTQINHLNNVALKAFKRLPPTVWKDYNSALPPGTMVDSPFFHEKKPLETPEKNFCLLLFKPIEIMVLQLGVEKHLKAIFSKSDKTWKKSWAIP